MSDVPAAQAGSRGQQGVESARAKLPSGDGVDGGDGMTGKNGLSATRGQRQLAEKLLRERFKAVEGTIQEAIRAKKAEAVAKAQQAPEIVRLRRRAEKLQEKERGLDARSNAIRNERYALQNEIVDAEKKYLAGFEAQAAQMRQKAIEDLNKGLDEIWKQDLPPFLVAVVEKLPSPEVLRVQGAMALGIGVEPAIKALGAPTVVDAR